MAVMYFHDIFYFSLIFNINTASRISGDSRNPLQFLTPCNHIFPSRNLWQDDKDRLHHPGEQVPQRLGGWPEFPPQGQFQRSLQTQLPARSSICYWDELRKGPKDPEVLTLVPVDMTLFGNGLFADDPVKMRSLEWGLLQYKWGSYKKRKSGHRDIHI